MGKPSSFPIPRVIPSVEEFISSRIYDPYEEPLDVILEGSTVILKNGDKWKIVMNSDEGSFIFEGVMCGYYDIDRVKDIWTKQGEIYSIRNIQKLKHK